MGVGLVALQLIAVIDKCEVYGDDGDCEDEKGDGDGNVQADGHVSSFLTLHQVMENEQRRYVSLDVVGFDVSNNLDPEDPEESSLVQFTWHHQLGLKMWKILKCCFQRLDSMGEP